MEEEEGLEDEEEGLDEESVCFRDFMLLVVF